MKRRVVLLALATLALGAAAGIVAVAVGARLIDRPDTYESRVQEIIARHNAISQRWNEFLNEFNSAEPDAVPEFYDRFESAAALTAALAVDAQSIISDWNKIEPPRDYLTAHNLASSALRKTQDAFLAFEEYFRRTVEEGFPPDELRSEGRETLEEVADLWQQVKAQAP